MGTGEQLIFFNEVGQNFGVGFTTPEDWSAMPSSGSTFSFQEFKDKYEIYISDGRRQFSIEIEKIDAKAFIVQHSINDIKGGMVKKRPLH